MPPTTPPSIYDSMAKGMPVKADQPKAGGAKGGGSPEEKKQIVTTLLEVLKKWDALESDAAGKKIIADMSALAERYKSEVLKEGGAAPAASPTEPPPDAAAASSDMGQKNGGAAKMAVPA